MQPPGQHDGADRRATGDGGDGGTAPRAPRKLDRTVQRRRVAATEDTAAAIPRRPRDGAAPLSFAQERLWFLEQLAPGSALFNVPVAVWLRGPLRVDALERAFADVVRRHETLRTHFAEHAGAPRQVVTPPGEARIELLDLAPHGPAAADEARRIARAQAVRPFDLQRPPLWRASLLRSSEREHLFVLVVHHSVAEGAGIATCFAELVAGYGAAVAGTAATLPEPPIQYADFAVWQRAQIESGACAGDLAYWSQQLAGPLPTLQLPTDRPRPAVQSLRGAWESTHLDAGLARALRDLAHGERATLFITLLAAFKVLLARYSRSTDIVVGAPISQRDRPELAGLIGFFVNTIALRTDLSGDPTFRELIGRVRGVALDGYAHSALPFKVLVEALQPDRDPGRNPLFQVFFEVPSDPMPVLALPGLEPARIQGPLELNTGTAKADLALFMWEEPDGMTAAIEYATDLFDAGTVQRLLANLKVLLAGCTADPDARISRLPLLAPAEQRRVVMEWNATAAAFDLETCVHRMVEQQAARAPGALAVASAAESLDYGEWNRRANRLAHWLRARGVGPDVPVGVLMERTPAMVTALLAILKAGGAYVPLDPANPTERQAMMLEDAAVPVLLVQESTLGAAPRISGEVVCLERVADAIAQQPAHDPGLEVTSQHLAYVIFTSGSTGRPKGVQVPHRGLLNLVHWHRREYAVTPADRASLIAGLAFDAAVWEVWPYLTAGASLHLPDEETRSDPARLLRWLGTRGITLAFVPTPLAEAMLEEECPEHMTLRAMLTGGDKLHAPPPVGLPFELVNHYGPTENTVVATFARIPPAPGRDGAPPIGRPIANVQVYLLDPHMAPVPIGVPGELHVGGASLARGYHGRPDLTAERFVPDPFRAGARVYKTGDLARHRPDGDIEFLGRIDHQVKVRGFRIELGEIEAALVQHPGVRDAVVLARTDAGEARLVGYVVADAGAQPTAAELRAFLKGKLPEYMVPQAYVSLAAFPLTANGKVDRGALPAPDEDAAPGAGTYTAPENETQEKVAALWRELLQRERVGIDDNFFDLGGHSMLIVQLHRRLKETFGRELSVAEVFQYPTIAAMALHLSGEKPADEAHDDRTEQRRAGADRQRQRRERRRRS
jgi:amino acid adenylation domain-containing protein